MDRNFFESRVSSGDDIADKDDASDIKEILDEDIANHKGLDPIQVNEILSEFQKRETHTDTRHTNFYT